MYTHHFGTENTDPGSHDFMGTQNPANPDETWFPWEENFDSEWPGYLKSDEATTAGNNDSKKLNDNISHAPRVAITSATKLSDGIEHDLAQQIPAETLRAVETPWENQRPSIPSDYWSGATPAHAETSCTFMPSTQTVNSPMADSQVSVTNKQPAVHIIGHVYATNEADSFMIRCSHPNCMNKSYGRWHDFRRHYNGAHAAAPTWFWCEVEGCPRSRAGDRPFPRKDKLGDHVRAVHEGTEEEDTFTDELQYQMRLEVEHLDFGGEFRGNGT